jgi:organic hydroperoxide reductase OsmC/OhrA
MAEAQSEHLASIDWQRGKWADAKGKYSREHTWWLAGGAKFKASDAYFLLPEGYRDGAKIDPEKMFVVTIASAHMLSWLHLAFGMGSEVLAYSDEAHGVMTELGEGGYWVSEIILHPRITYSQRSSATPAAEARLHELAHEQCFIANSIKTKVTVRGAHDTRLGNTPQ